MNVPLILAGSLAVLGASVHGAGGEILVVRNLSPASLPGSRFGGPKATMAMIMTRNGKATTRSSSRIRNVSNRR